MAVVAVALLGVEVAGADQGCAGDHLAAGRHTQLSYMVGYWAAEAPHHLTYTHTHVR